MNLDAGLAQAVLPPAGLAVPALLLLLLGRRWRWVAWLLLGLLTVLSMRVVARVLLRGLVLAPVPAPPSMVAQAPQAIVILPGDHVTIGDPAWREPSALTLERLRTGAAMHRQSGLPILVTGGTSPDGSLQADAMASSLRTDFQVPVRWEDASAHDLAGQAAASAALLREAGLASVYLVADPWEMRRDLEMFRRAGLEVTPAPVRRPRPIVPIPLEFAPATPAWLDSAIAVREWADFVFDRVTRGRPAPTP